MSIIFISDLHLKPEIPEINQVFLNFLKQQVSRAEALYILGDFFEYWLGDECLDDFNKEIIIALREMTQKGILIYFMHGNRDFLVDKNFLRSTGCQLLNDPSVIDLYGKTTLLTHGDLLCTLDTSYQRLRNIRSNSLLQRLFLMLPLNLRVKIVNKLRRISKRKGERIGREMIKIKFDAVFSTIIEMMQKHQTKLLIHGHTHHPSIHFFKLENELVQRIVLSDWHHNGNALICEPSGEMRLIYF